MPIRIHKARSLSAPLLLMLGCSTPTPMLRPADNGPAVVHGAWASRVDARLSSLEAIGLSGSVVVTRAGNIVLEASYGFADRPKGIPNAPSTAFDIASVTKLVTAIAVLRLVDSGLLSLDDSIGRYVRGMPGDKRGITVRQLLAHRSGLQLYHDEDVRRLGKDQAIQRILAAPLRNAPGGRYAYSNSGYPMLAAVIEAAAETTFTEFVRREVLVPAGMTRTGWFGDSLWNNDEIARGYASQHERGESRVTGKASWTLLGAGGMVATASDLNKLVRGLRGGLLLSPGSLAQLVAPTAPCPAPLTDNALGIGVWTGSDGEVTAEKGGYAAGRGYSAMVRFRPSTGDAVVFTLNDDWDELYPIGIHNALVRTIDRSPTGADRLEVDPVGSKPGNASFLGAEGRVQIQPLAAHVAVRAEGPALISAIAGGTADGAAKLDSANTRAQALIAGRDTVSAVSNCHGEVIDELRQTLNGATAIRVLGTTPEWLLDVPDEVTYVAFRRNSENRMIRLHWLEGVLHSIGGGALISPFIGEVTNSPSGLRLTHAPLGLSQPMHFAGDSLVLFTAQRSFVFKREKR